jgi:hypothetical protein
MGQNNRLQLNLTVFPLVLISFLTFAQNKKGLSLEGDVFDGSKNRRLAGAKVYLDKTKHTTTTDSTGVIKLTKLRKGNYELVATAAGFKTERRAITIDAEKPMRLRIYLNPTQPSLADSWPIVPKGQLPIFLKNWREKVYVQTDRAYYMPSDTVFFKALIKYSNSLYQDSLSKVLHVDLYTNDKILISKKKFKIKNGAASSAIIIPDNLPSDIYYLVAYTGWMTNFNEYFIKPIPVGELGKLIKVKALDTVSHLPSQVKLKIEFPKSVGPRESVFLRLQAVEEIDSIKSLSVSLTDLKSNLDIDGAATINFFDHRFEGDDINVLKIKHQIENSIVYQGRVHKVFNEKRELNPVFKENVVVKAFVPSHRKIYMSPPVVKGRFEIGFDYADTASVSFAGETKKGLKYGDIEILPQDTLKANFILPNLEYEQDNYTSPTMPKQFAKDSKILKEVTVKARKIEPKRLLKLPIPPIPLGFAQKTSKVEDVKSMRKLNQLKYAIQYMVRGEETPIEDTDDFYYGINRGTALPYLFYLNGNRTYYNDLRMMPTSDLTKIEIYGSEGISGFATGANSNPEDKGGLKAGIILIYTEPYFDANLDPQAYATFQLMGFDQEIKFSPIKAASLLNFRPTVYWNPSVEFNAQRAASLNFICSDFDGQFKLTIEGLTKKGEPIRIVKILNQN